MGSKRGPLSKAEVFYIEEHIKSGKDINEIATDLDRAVKSIEKCVTKVQKELKKSPLTSDQFARRPGVTVMTENASTMGDATRSRKSPSSLSCITKIKDE
jgi:hypothetical protein